MMHSDTTRLMRLAGYATGRPTRAATTTDGSPCIAFVDEDQGGHAQAIKAVLDPLNDYSDAMCLMITMGKLHGAALHVSSNGTVVKLSDPRARVITEPHGSDAHEATKRAILKAAAEIGRLVKQDRERGATR